MIPLLMFATLSLAALPTDCEPKVPSVDVPSCSRGVGTIKYNKSVPDLKPFPLTEVDLCYTDTHLDIRFIARDEVNFYYNLSQSTNANIWEYEVMEAFIYKGTDNPKKYLEFEVNPNNITYQAFVYNPSKVRADGAPFDHFFVLDPGTDGFSAVTKLVKPKQLWVSDVKIPLGLFNIDTGRAKGTEWRMNFFRTVVSSQTYPNQDLGAWSVPNKAEFHITSYFGKVKFV
ncbi:carbohydrate-binding domain, family 9-like, subgroup [Pochonia chlamydosporia 170]|uniref:Carbohydrate-binding domain, family 9-like, subgroup n=1 Tax=Pochonia chlamydosporia 170 TaxID=1380566 RepID=A0A179FIG2_METCM|nr:carbohydrate-binding domain, family 9-like, subgroup [Pochonia chlamydosporia 170]OAQ65356.1 carbohydrate-binding domain, family 9-like, subgroup [Pochonia chlamydosporia 170]